MNLKKIRNIEVKQMKFIFIRHAKDDENYRGGWSSQDIYQREKNKPKS